MDKLISDYTVTRVESGCAPVSGKYGLQINVIEDISPVFPFLNATLDETRYDHENRILIWKEQDRAYALRPHEIIVVSEQGIEQPEQVRNLVNGIVDRINRTWETRNTIKPSQVEKKRPSVIDFYRFLPKTNCKQCGCATCLVFADELRQGKAKPESCPPLLKTENAASRKKLADLLQTMQ